MANSENTITSAFVNVLRYMREAWRVDEQITKPFLNATQKPDVIVSEKGRNPVVIEVKVDGDTPNYTGKLQAEAHFGMLLSIHLLLNEVLDITSEDATMQSITSANYYLLNQASTAERNLGATLKRSGRNSVVENFS